MFVSWLLGLFNHLLAFWFIREQKSWDVRGAVGTTSMAFAGGRQVMEESSCGAWTWGLSSGSESLPGFCRTNPRVLLCACTGSSHILTRVLLEAVCRAFPCLTPAWGCWG